MNGFIKVIEEVPKGIGPGVRPSMIVDISRPESRLPACAFSDVRMDCGDASEMRLPSAGISFLIDELHSARFGR